MSKSFADKLWGVGEGEPPTEADVFFTQRRKAERLCPLEVIRNYVGVTAVETTVTLVRQSYNGRVALTVSKDTQGGWDVAIRKLERRPSTTSDTPAKKAMQAMGITAYELIRLSPYLRIHSALNDLENPQYTGAIVLPFVAVLDRQPPLSRSLTEFTPYQEMLIIAQHWPNDCAPTLAYDTRRGLEASGLLTESPDHPDTTAELGEP